MKLKFTRVQEILNILSNTTDPSALKTALDTYHPSDVAHALQELDIPARKNAYALFDAEGLSAVFLSRRAVSGAGGRFAEKHGRRRCR